jgi:hypothetical protein
MRGRIADEAQQLAARRSLWRMRRRIAAEAQQLAAITTTWQIRTADRRCARSRKACA